MIDCTYLVLVFVCKWIKHILHYITYNHYLFKMQIQLYTRYHDFDIIDFG